jgi:hypothetical protein
MNKKLLALLIALVVSPMSQSFAKTDWEKKGFFGKLPARSGLTTDKGYNDGNRAWGNFIGYTAPAVLGLLSTGVIIYKLYVNSKVEEGQEKLSFKEFLKNCFTSPSEAFAKDKLLAASIYGVSVSILVAGSYGLYNLFFGGKEKTLDELKKEQTAKETEIADLKTKLGAATETDEKKDLADQIKKAEDELTELKKTIKKKEDEKKKTK